MVSARDFVLVSISAALGALSSAIALRLISSNSKCSGSHSFPPEVNESLDDAISQSPFDPSKRKGYLSWDDYFMAIAFLSAKRSKDPNRQVGACLVSHHGIILGIGYNGFPRGCSDDKLPWAKMSFNGDQMETKYPYVVHAEVNAILNTNHASAAGQRLYVTMFPCNECAKVIIQSGVSEVIYFVEKRVNNSDVAYSASHKLLSMAGVKTPIAEKMRKARLKWFGQVQRRPLEAPIRHCERSITRHVKQERGRPIKTWNETIRKDMIYLGVRL